MGVGADQKTVALAFQGQKLVKNGQQLLALLEVNPSVDACVQALQGNKGAEATMWCGITPASAQAARSVQEVMSRIGEPLSL